MFHAAVQHIEGYIAARPIEKIETHAAYAALMQSVEFALRRLVVDTSHAVKASLRMRNRIEGRGVIEPMHARLNDNRSFNADHRHHFHIML